MKKKPPGRSRSAGTTLVEMTAALFIFGIIATVLVQFTTLSLSHQRAVHDRRLATVAATELLEEALDLPWEKLTADQLNQLAQRAQTQLGDDFQVTATLLDLTPAATAADELRSREIRALVTLEERWLVRVELVAFRHERIATTAQEENP